MKKQNLIKIIKTCVILLIISLIWFVLEMIFYGEYQPRIVDDVIMLIFIPFIWKSIPIRKDVS